MASPRKRSPTDGLPAPLKRYALKKLRTGEYRSAQDVVTDALRVLKERDDYIAEVRAKVLEGERAIREGRVIPLDEVMDRLRARAARRSSTARRRKSA